VRGWDIHVVCKGVIGEKNMKRISVPNHEWARPPAKLWHRWERNVVVNITEAVCEGMGSG
jgi:hypothetical protein